MTKRGIFISFEGGEGAGKTTLVNHVEAALVARGERVVRTREPGGTPQSEALRDLVVNGEVGKWDAVSETALFLTARRLHVQQVIEPALAAGSTVLCDRFLDSTLVYQGMAKKLGVEAVMQLSQLIVGPIQPDLTLLVDIPTELGLSRAGSRPTKENRFEAHGAAFHQAIREGFLSLAQQCPQRITVLDGSQAPQSVLEKALEHILPRIQGRH